MRRVITITVALAVGLVFAGAMSVASSEDPADCTRLGEGATTDTPPQMQNCLSVGLGSIYGLMNHGGNEQLNCLPTLLLGEVCAHAIAYTHWDIDCIGPKPPGTQCWHMHAKGGGMAWPIAPTTFGTAHVKGHLRSMACAFAGGWCYTPDFWEAHYVTEGPGECTLTTTVASYFGSVEASATDICD